MQTTRTATSLVALAALAALGLAARPAAAQQTLYVSNTGTTNKNTVEKITPDGVGTTFVSGLSLPEGLAFDGAGNLFIADLYGGNILKATPGGATSVFTSSVFTPSGLAFDSAGNLYAGSYYYNTITKFAADGTSSLFASNPAGPGSTVLAIPFGMKFDAAGNLYVVNDSNVRNATSNGNSVEKITPNGTTSVFATAGLNNPADLAFDSAGNLYVSNSSSNTIEKFATDGTASVFASGLNGPQGLAFDSAGFLYVANNKSNNIERFTPDGVGSVYLQDPGDKSVLDSPSFIAFGPAAAPVPEASTTVSLGLLLTLGLAGVAFKARKRSAKTA